MESLPPPVDASDAATALFSLQVCVDTVQYDPPPALPSARGSASSAECLLAFQLLQFDIVLFDESVLNASSIDNNQRYHLNEAQGQSCLFECDPQRLAQDIRDDESAALVLLVLQRDDQKARLEAFACVRLELPHLAFSVDNKRPRVSEWVAVDATWPLVNHQHQSVGFISGSVTLSCLGRALAPHLIAQRFNGGFHVLTKASTPRAASSPQHRVDETTTHIEEGTGSDISQATAEEDPTEAKALSPKKTALPSSPITKRVDQVRDAAVQCVSEDEDEDEGSLSRSRSPKPILIHGSSRDHATGYRRERRLVDELDRMKIASNGSPRRIGERNPRHTYISYTRETPRRRGDRVAAAAVASVVPDSELPPPLFFHKPKQQKR